MSGTGGWPSNRYYVTGGINGQVSSFGQPCGTLEDAVAYCRQRHEAGYRMLRVWDHCKGAYARYNIKTGLGPWYQDHHFPYGTATGGATS